MEDNLNLGSLNLHTQIDRKSVVMNMGDAGNWATRIFSGTKGFLALPFRPLFHDANVEHHQQKIYNRVLHLRLQCQDSRLVMMR